MSPQMNITLKVEELTIFLASIAAFATMNFSWWLYPAFLLLPDLAMLGYLINTRFGAFIYNFAHHRATGILTYGLGYVYVSPILMLTGIILIGHTAMDRLAGYGLKYADNFHHTHLGWLKAEAYGNKPADR